MKDVWVRIRLIWEGAQQLFSKSILYVSFVQSKCQTQNCCDLRTFLRVKFGSTVLLRVKELTFCNSGQG